MATGSVSPKAGKIVDIPNTPTIGTATAGVESASLTFTAPTVGGPVFTYRALSSPGSITGTGTTSPISITGLTGGTAYTFQIRAENATGNSLYSSASNSVTPALNTSFESIATINVTSNQSSVQFTSIPQTYKHLQLRAITRENRSVGSNVILTGRVFYNSDTSAANYTLHQIYGDGSSAAAWGSGSSVDPYLTYDAGANGALANVFGATIIDILDYTDTNKFTTTRSLTGIDNNGTGVITLMSSLWRNTAAITSITLSAYNNVDSFWAQYTQFALYGIKGA